MAVGLVSQIAGSTTVKVLRATKRSSALILRSTAQIALAVRLDLVLDQTAPFDLERLEFLGQHAVVARPYVDRHGLRSGGAEDPFSGDGHATLG